jgi:hypothetical protein
LEDTEESTSDNFARFNSAEWVVKTRDYLRQIGLPDLAYRVEHEFEHDFLERGVEYLQERSHVDEQAIIIGALLSEVDRLRHSYTVNDIIVDRFLEINEAEVKGQFDQSNSYNTVISTIGFAGMFAVWANVGGQLPDVVNYFVGFALGLALLFFVIWTLVLGHIMSVSVRRSADVVLAGHSDFAEFQAARAKAQSKNRKIALGIQRFHPPIFFLTSCLGLIAGLTLLLSFIYGMFGWEIVDTIPFSWLGFALGHLE